MDLGFVGVGPWAQKLATAFRECGAEVVCYDRERRDDYPVWLAHDVNDGKHIPFGSWQNQVSDPDIDALIICAPPDVTTEVALACAKAGKRCVATKPLLWTEMPGELTRHMPPGSAFHGPRGGPNDRCRHCGLFEETCSLTPGCRSRPQTELYVDLWRLYSPAWLAMKEELRGKKIDTLDVVFRGAGPVRSFPGALDYGPHAFAFAYDLLGATELSKVEWSGKNPWDRSDGDLYSIHAEHGETFVSIEIGNGAEVPTRSVVARLADGSSYVWDEPDKYQTQHFGDECGCTKQHALRRFCRAFMAGEASRTLEFSIAAQRVLERIVGCNSSSSA